MASISYSVGAGGAGGTGGDDGVSGGNSTFTYNAVTYTAGGGSTIAGVASGAGATLRDGSLGGEKAIGEESATRGGGGAGSPGGGKRGISSEFGP